ncbi:MAG: TetR/AcrR family transcriptional regulator [Spirochaetota bacterium]
MKKKAARSLEKYHHGNLKESVLHLSELHLEKLGAEKLSLRDIAAELQVSHTAPYRHFANKEVLLYALAERGFSALADAMESSYLKGKTFREKLQQAGLAYVKLAIAFPKRTELMFSASRKAEPRKIPESLSREGDRAFVGLHRIVLEGVQAGEFVQEEPLQLSCTAWSLVHGIATLLNGGGFPLPLGSDKALRQFVMQSLLTLETGMLQSERKSE